MLDEFCGKLSDEAQLKIALRLSRMALPIWQKYFDENPADIEKVNALISDANRVQAGAEKIDITFPSRALEKIERSYNSAKLKGGLPLPIMKTDSSLTPVLATVMQPLTNTGWDAILTQSVRLVYNAVFNIITWILLHRKTTALETHIYVAINQAADVLMRESIFTASQLDSILTEYKSEKRQENEGAEWEKVKRAVDKKMVSDSYGSELAIEVVRQMREEGKMYWNELDEFSSGTSTTYYYSKEKQHFERNEFDVVVGSFNINTLMTEDEMLRFVGGLSLHDLRESGFEV